MDASAGRPTHPLRALPWRRYFARVIDAWLFTFVLSAAAKAAGLTAVLNTQSVFASFLFFSLQPVAEFAFLWGFGNSPGKMLLGLRIEWGSPMPMPRQVFGRCFDVFLFGQAMNIPLLTMVAEYMAGLHIKKSGRARWDEKWGTQVVRVFRM